ncbi:MAG: DNA primase [Anaerolineae bacterium]|nr:DNA primase [Anaerolineae bacterium]
MSVIDDVKNRLDIVDVVSGYTTLQKAGRNYKALCPFHQEKTPSFVVFPETQTWRCFGACGEGGDAFNFVMKAEGWDFSETLRELAKRVGVEITPFSSEQTQRQEESERLQAILDETARLFHDQLLNLPAAQVARDYVVNRGLSAETVAAFMLGYAPDDYRSTLQHLQMHGYSQDEIVEAGVAIRNDKGNVYDRFRHRLVIPIRDSRGRTVGFGARAFAKDAVPKYLNSPQGLLFDKSQLLFGLDMARRAIRETETVVIVEGYMDVMQAHQAGFANVVAQMGTALTETQLKQLDRYANRLILALDPDMAGVNATMRGLNVAQQTLGADQQASFDPRGMIRYTGMLNMDIRVVTLPDGQDPDDLIRENPAAWEALVGRAIPIAEYVIQQSTASLNRHSSYHERERVARDLLPILTATESDLQRNGNIQSLARRVWIDEKTLMQWTQRRRAIQTRAVPTVHEQRQLAGRSSYNHPGRGSKSGKPGQTTAPQESLCLSLLLEQPDRLAAANRKLRELQTQDAHVNPSLGPLGTQDFSRGDYQAIFDVLERSLYQDELDPLDYVFDYLPHALAERVDQLLALPHEVVRRALPPQDSATAYLRTLPGVTQFTSFEIESLILRQSRIERELQELYFLQQDSQFEENELTDYHYQERLRDYSRARRLITLTLRDIRGYARNV